MARELMLVYTVGKVASTTISSSLLDAGVPCYDVHNLIDSNILDALQVAANAGALPPAHIGTSISILADFKNVTTPVKIITCFRDSLIRNISAIFQNLPEGANSITMKDVRQRIERTNPDKTGAWMRKEFGPATGINLLEAGFDPVAKHGRYREGRFDVLMLRTDLDDSTKAKLISDFVGKPVVLNRSNDSTEKWYSDLYKQFNDSGKISGAWIDECLNSAYMQTFYTANEVAEFKAAANKWRAED